jgi:hypothetical protein
MMDQRIDAAQEAVEQLANSVGPVPPPRGLKAGRRPGMGGVALAVLLAAAVSVAWWMQMQSPTPALVPAPASASEGAGVVVEHLRIRGRSVQAKVERLPEAGAVMVTVAEDAEESSVPEPDGEDS